MIMLPYLLSALYYAKLTSRRKNLGDISSGELARERIFAIIGSIYGVWMIISAGIVQFLVTSILYAPGILVYIKGRKEKNLSSFRPYERNIAILLICLAVLSIILLFMGIINPF